MKHFSIADLDRQAAIDMEAWRQRSGFRAYSTPEVGAPKPNEARCRVLRVAMAGWQSLGEFAVAAGYSSAAAAAQMVNSLEGDGLLKATRFKVPGKSQVRVMINITQAGRDWLAANEVQQ